MQEVWIACEIHYKGLADLALSWGAPRTTSGLFCDFKNHFASHLLTLLQNQAYFPGDIPAVL